MSEYKGFRIWNVNFQALEATTSGVTIEYENDGTTPTGRLLMNGAFAGYYPNTQDVGGESLALGVKASLEDTCAPLVDADVNGVGWSLDTDLYTRLNSLEASAYPLFKEKNPLLWTPDTPTLSNGNNAPKSVRIIPCSYVYAMFFKHTTGHKLMVMLNYAGMHTNLSAYNNSYKLDAGFLRNHIHSAVMSKSSTSYSGSSAVGGFILSMMPPSNEDWHPEYQIRDELFYPVSSFHIVSQFSAGFSYSYGSSTPSWKCASWLRVGTNTANTGTTSTAGVLVGTVLKTSILADSKGNIGIGYRYKASSNTTDMNPLMFIGPFYTTMLNSNNVVPHRFLASFGNSLNRYASENSSTNYSMSAWYSANHDSYCNNSSHNYTSYLHYMTSDGDSDYIPVYTAYPAISSEVYSTYRYSKAAYTTSGLLDSEVLRFVNPAGILSGQTYNDGQWCFIPSIASQYVSLVAEDGTTSSEYLYPVIRWDTEFNGTDTFC